jgi:hypothetical protein
MITIVSGLPRSGTSLLMQMLHAGGFPLLHDDQRLANEDNPRGFFEYAPVRRLEQSNGWLAEAEGKGLKVVSPLLTHLPPQFAYHLIFMKRSLDEVLRSQAQMLARQGHEVPRDHGAMRGHFERHLASIEVWLGQQSNFTRLTLDYADVVASPQAAAEQLARFLQSDVDRDRMAAAVDPALYRQQKI